MNIKIYPKVIAMLAISLCTTSAHATTSYVSQGDLFLELIGYIDSSGTKHEQLSSITVTSTSSSSETPLFQTGDAFADSVAGADADSSFISVDTQVSGYAGNHYALANSEASANATFSFENTSTEDVTVELVYGYDFSGKVAADTPADNQNGQATFILDLYGDFSLDTVLEISEKTELGQDAFSGKQENQGISFLLAAGETENVFAEITSYGESESISAVPVPPSIWFMSSALIGLLIRRKTVTA